MGTLGVRDMSPAIPPDKLLNTFVARPSARPEDKPEGKVVAGATARTRNIHSHLARIFPENGRPARPSHIAFYVTLAKRAASTLTILLGFLGEY